MSRYLRLEQWCRFDKYDSSWWMAQRYRQEEFLGCITVDLTVARISKRLRKDVPFSLLALYTVLVERQAFSYILPSVRFSADEQLSYFV